VWRHFGLASLAAAAAANVSALPPSHSPFFPDESYTVDLRACDTTLDVRVVHPPEGNVLFASGATTLQLRMVGLSGYEARVIDNDEPGEPVPIPVEATTPNDVEQDAVCADLNGDGRVDFVVSLWLHGNGLGADFYRRLIALSAPGGYRFWVAPTMLPSREDFVTFGSIARIVMLTTGFVQSGSSDAPGPNRRHSYYAYDLWRFEGGDIVGANAIDERFPKFVLMTSAPNHKPSVRMAAPRPEIAGERPVLVGPTEAR
jgi:hypothetical protein